MKPPVPWPSTKLRTKSYGATPPLVLCLPQLAQKATQNQDFGRSRDGFSIEIQLCTNSEGLPIDVVLTSGETHECITYSEPMRLAGLGCSLADQAKDGEVVLSPVAQTATCGQFLCLGLANDVCHRVLRRPEQWLDLNRAQP